MDPDESSAGVIRPAGSVAVLPGSQADFVALGVGEHPPRRRELVAHQVASGGNRCRYPLPGMVVRHPDIEMYPVALLTRRVHLLEPDRRPCRSRIEQVFVAHLAVSERRAPE